MRVRAAARWIAKAAILGGIAAGMAQGSSALTASASGQESCAWEPVNAAEAGAQILASVNRERSGVATLTTHEQMARVAQEHSERMAAQGRIFHNDALADRARTEHWGSTLLGENAGMGCSVEGVHQALMNSPGHRGNILNGRFNRAGVGAAVDEGGTLYVTEVFAEILSAPVMTAKVSPPLPAPAPAAPVKPSIDVRPDEAAAVVKDRTIAQEQAPAPVAEVPQPARRSNVLFGIAAAVCLVALGGVALRTRVGRAKPEWLPARW